MATCINDGSSSFNSNLIFRISIARFANSLKSFNGSIFYAVNSDSISYNENELSYVIRQGYYEASNVNLTGQLAQIPVVKNVYDANTKAVKTIIKSINSGITIGSPQ